jgi:hypothetical protein
MPVSVQIARLERELVSRQTEGFVVENTDLYRLVGTERDAALDAVVAGEPSPFVLMCGRLVCTGAVDTSAVLDALLVSNESVIAPKLEHAESQ